MENELQNMWFFVQAIFKVSLYTGLLPFLVYMLFICYRQSK